MWPLLPVLATPPRAAHRRPTGATRVHRAAQTPRRALPVPILTRPPPMLGEDFGAKKQIWGIIKNQTESLTKPEQIFNSVGDKIQDEVPHLRDSFPRLEVPMVYWSPGLSGLSYDITSEWVICQL
jgi:hypothetical protein